jgi:hypothetical protein
MFITVSSLRRRYEFVYPKIFLQTHASTRTIMGDGSWSDVQDYAYQVGWKVRAKCYFAGLPHPDGRTATSTGSEPCGDAMHPNSKYCLFSFRSRNKSPNMIIFQQKPLLMFSPCEKKKYLLLTII